MKCERILIYQWSGNEVWECKGRTLPPPPVSADPWWSPAEYDDYIAHHARWQLGSYPLLDPTAES